MVAEPSSETSLTNYLTLHAAVRHTAVEAADVALGALRFVL